MSPNKNFKSIVSAIKLLGNVNYQIVVAGGTNPRVFNKSEALPPNINYIGYIQDEQLLALYRHAACFIFPSLYEGFGLPPLEAMACGCPVVVSNVASLPEVCGDAALYCNPYDPQDIADKIRRIVTDQDLREQLRQKGFERVKQFSWERCAEETIKVIQEVLEG